MNWYHVDVSTNVPIEIAENAQDMSRRYLIQHSSLQEAVFQGLKAFLSETKTEATAISASLAEEKVLMNAPVIERKIEIVPPPRMTEKK